MFDYPIESEDSWHPWGEDRLKSKHDIIKTFSMFKIKYLKQSPSVSLIYVFIIRKLLNI